MKNGTESNRWFRLPNPERGNADDRSRWIVVVWSMRSSISFVRVVPGGCCQGILVRGKRCTATFDNGPRTGPGDSSTTRCETGCARARAEQSRRTRPLWTAKPSRLDNKPENADMTRAKRYWAAKYSAP